MLERRINYVGGVYKTPQSMQDTLKSIGLDMRTPFCKHFAVYDFEAYLQPLDEKTRSTQFTAEHVPISVSVCSTVEGFTKPFFILNKDSPQTLINEFMDFLFLVY